MDKTKKEDYIYHFGTKCLYCHSSNLDCNEIELYYIGEMKQEKRCLDCKKTWVDIYTITDIEIRV